MSQKKVNVKFIVALMVAVAAVLFAGQLRNSVNAEETGPRVERERASYLDHAVANGQLTQDQKDMILGKRESFLREKAEVKASEMTLEEKKLAYRELLDRLAQWCVENEVPYNLASMDL